ncbi:N-acetylglucosaminyltransferase [Phlyctochytrium planicorne]|nr:N-acetylglucosaminyltransferase [Phlyctochytrium planicorne]
MESSIGGLPSAIKLKILQNLLNQGNATTAPKHTVGSKPKPLSSRSLQNMNVSGLCNNLITKGYHIFDGLLEESKAYSVLKECINLREREILREAQMGSSLSSLKDTTLRGDRIKFFLNKDFDDGQTGDGHTIAEALFDAKRALEGVAHRLSTALEYDLGMKGIQLGFYGKGTRYTKHKDSSPLIPNRRLTLLLYMNPGWTEANGGHIRLYHDGSETDIAPLFNRLVVFDSSIEHEVLLSHSDRYAITMWLYSEADTSTIFKRYLSIRDTIASPSIFVSVASFCDPDVVNTLDSLFGMATFPERIRAGVFLQDDEEDRVRDFKQGKVCTLRVPSAEAKGPAYARWVIFDKLYRDEKYILQIDSHMRLEAGWDIKLLHLLEKRPASLPLSLISFYPPGFDISTGKPSSLPPYGPIVMKCKGLDKDGMPRMVGSLTFPPPDRKVLDNGELEPAELIRQEYLAAGFIFAPTEFARDGYRQIRRSSESGSRPESGSRGEVTLEMLTGLFFGEEAVLSDMLKRKGWTFWSPRDPDVTIAFHCWDRSYRKTLFGAMKEQEQEEQEGGGKVDHGGDGDIAGAKGEGEGEGEGEEDGSHLWPSITLQQRKIAQGLVREHLGIRLSKDGEYQTTLKGMWSVECGAVRAWE